MDGLESFGHERGGLRGLVDADGRDEDGALGHVAGAVDGVAPFAPEVGLEPALRGGRDDRQAESGAAQASQPLFLLHDSGD